MLVAELFWGLLAAVLLADLLRIRNRLTSIPTLRPNESEPAPDLVVVAAPGITVPVSVVESAIAHMKANELRGLELIPGQLSLATAWSMGCHIDRRPTGRKSLDQARPPCMHSSLQRMCSISWV